MAPSTTRASQWNYDVLVLSDDAIIRHYTACIQKRIMRQQTWSSSRSLSDWRSLVSLASTSVLHASLAVSDISSTYNHQAAALLLYTQLAYILYIITGVTCQYVRTPRVTCRFGYLQHLQSPGGNTSAWNDIMAAIWKMWHQIKNATPSIGMYLLEEHLLPNFIPIWFEITGALAFFEEVAPTRTTITTITRWVVIWDQFLI